MRVADTRGAPTLSKNDREVMGGAYLDHPALRPFKSSVVNKEYPITCGVQDFMVNDEQQFVTYDKDSQYTILRSDNIDGLTDIHEGKGLGVKAIAGGIRFRQGLRGLHRSRPCAARFVAARVFQAAKERSKVAAEDGIATPLSGRPAPLRTGARLNCRCQ